jgi:NitT/TauT family transport system substrate-binding protein
MDYRVKFGIAAAIVAAVVATSGISSGGSAIREPESDVLRIGYFPNISHAQAVIGVGNGDFQRTLGDIEIQAKLFNAGPAAIEALFSKQIDVAYIGPNPAINGYMRSEGEALRIIAGAASGGAVFVVRNDAGIDSVQDLAGKTFSSPQLGNTQDVALRNYLLENGYEDEKNVKVLPAANSEIVTLMLRKDIHGAWVPEPWGARLVEEANAKIFLDERELWPEGQFVTAHIIVRTAYLESNPETIKKLLEAHIDETLWIKDNPEEAMAAFNEELQELTGQTIQERVLSAGMSRMELTWDPVQDSLFQSANDAFEIGFFDERPDLTGIYDLTLLNEVLSEEGLPEVQ